MGPVVARIGRTSAHALTAAAALTALAGLTVLTAGCADDPPDVRVGSQVAASGDGDDGGAGADGVPAPADAGAPAEWNGTTVVVQALDNTFRPAALEIEAGTEVVFDNVGRNEHNVIPEPDSIQGWGVGDDRFAPGDRYAHVFTEPGFYEYVCTIHGVDRKGMVGTITVTASGGT